MKAIVLAILSITITGCAAQWHNVNIDNYTGHTITGFRLRTEPKGFDFNYGVIMSEYQHSPIGEKGYYGPMHIKPNDVCIASWIDILAALAYKKSGGKLTPPWPIANDHHTGAMYMFQGYFKYLRNAYGHTQQVLANEEKDGVIEQLQLAQALLAIIELSKPRSISKQ